MGGDYFVKILKDFNLSLSLSSLCSFLSLSDLRCRCQEIWVSRFGSLGQYPNQGNPNRLPCFGLVLQSTNTTENRY